VVLVLWFSRGWEEREGDRKFLGVEPCAEVPELRGSMPKHVGPLRPADRASAGPDRGVKGPDRGVKRPDRGVKRPARGVKGPDRGVKGPDRAI